MHYNQWLGLYLKYIGVDLLEIKKVFDESGHLAAWLKLRMFKRSSWNDLEHFAIMKFGNGLNTPDEVIKVVSELHKLESMLENYQEPVFPDFGKVILM